MEIKTKLRSVRDFMLGFITCFLLFALAVSVGANLGHGWHRQRTENVDIVYYDTTNLDECQLMIHVIDYHIHK